MICWFIDENLYIYDATGTVNILFKDRKFSFPVHKYPLMSSLIPESIPYAVFTGSLYRAFNICRPNRDPKKNSFTNAAIMYAQKLYLNGCTVKKLKKKFSEFVFKRIQRHDQPNGMSLLNYQKQVCKEFNQCLPEAVKDLQQRC